MKHFGVYAVLSVMLVALFGGFAFPEKTFAEVTDQQIASMKLDCDNNFTYPSADSLGMASEIHNLCKGMVDGVASRLKNDPEVNLYQFKRYVYNGIPGATNLYEKGFIPWLQEKMINNTGVLGPSDNDRSLARVALAQAQQISANTIVNEQEVGGVITSDQARAQRLENARVGAGQVNAELQKRPERKCSLISDSPIINCLDAGLTWFVKSILLEFVGFFLWASANLLNYAMYHGVFKFKDFAPNDIYAIWLVVRQIVSLFVFFAGLFVGFMAIIGKSEEFKKYIAFLVVFGLFVNFSYPVVRVFVDISNVVSLQIYQTTMGGEILADNATDSAGARIMSKMGLQQLALSATAASSGGTTKFADSITSLPGALAAVAFVGFAAYVLFMAAFLLIARTALLICIIIASPILLVDTVVPALGEKAQWLRGMFISQLFVAPVFTIMLALTLKFLDIFSNTAGNPLNGASNALNASASASSATVFFNLVMMLVMLFIMLKVTKAVAGGVGETVTKWAGKAGGLGVGLTTRAAFAGVGFAGRNTLGKAGEYLGQQGGIIGDLGRKMAGGKYDLRNLSTVQSLAQTAGISGMGKGVDKNRKDLANARDEENTKIAQGIDNDEGRELFMRRKFSTGGIAGITGATPNSKAYRNFTKSDDEMLKQYINADEDKRKEMMEDDKNKRFAQRFQNIESGATGAMSDKVQKALSDKLAKDRAKEVRNTDRIANFLTADAATRESIRTNAIAENNKTLLDQLGVMEDLRNQQAGTLTQEMVKSLGDPALEAKVLANDTARATAQMAQQNQAAAQEAQATIQKAQLSAAQAQAQATQDTNAALASLAQAQNDLAQQLKTLVTP